MVPSSTCLDEHYGTLKNLDRVGVEGLFCKTVQASFRGEPADVDWRARTSAIARPPGWKTRSRSSPGLMTLQRPGWDMVFHTWSVQMLATEGFNEYLGWLIFDVDGIFSGFLDGEAMEESYDNVSSAARPGGSLGDGGPPFSPHEGILGGLTCR